MPAGFPLQSLTHSNTASAASSLRPDAIAWDFRSSYAISRIAITPPPAPPLAGQRHNTHAQGQPSCGHLRNTITAALNPVLSTGLRAIMVWLAAMVSQGGNGVNPAGLTLVRGGAAPSPPSPPSPPPPPPPHIPLKPKCRPTVSAGHAVLLCRKLVKKKIFFELTS
ncbi:MAG TPA: hypothetical protein VF610_05745 [Segetibacter sp.]